MALATAIYRMSAKGFRCQTIITSPSDHSIPLPLCTAHSLRPVVVQWF